MNIDKFTEKTKTFLQHAQTLAMRSHHQSLEPEHVLKAMLDDESAIAKKLIQAADADFVGLLGAIEQAISKFPSVQGSGAGQTRISTDL